MVVGIKCGAGVKRCMDDEIIDSAFSELINCLSMEQNDPVQRLPADVFLQIFRRLDSPTLFACIQVNRQWWSAALQVLYEHPSMRYPSSWTKLIRELEDKPIRAQWVLELDFSEIYYVVTNTLLERMLQLTTNLKLLNVRTPREFSPDLLVMLPRSLKILRLERCPHIDNHIPRAISGMTDLQLLSVAGTRGLTDVALYVMGSMYETSRLTHLDLSFCERITVAGLVALLNHTTKLQNLRLAKLPINTAVIKAISRLALTNLDLSYCSLNSEESALLAIPSLKMLDLRGTNFDDANTRILLKNNPALVFIGRPNGISHYIEHEIIFSGITLL